jgi:hypothetical protein
MVMEGGTTIREKQDIRLCRKEGRGDSKREVLTVNGESGDGG